MGARAAENGCSDGTGGTRETGILPQEIENGPQVTLARGPLLLWQGSRLITGSPGSFSQHHPGAGPIPAPAVFVSGHIVRERVIVPLRP